MDGADRRSEKFSKSKHIKDTVKRAKNERLRYLDQQLYHVSKNTRRVALDIFPLSKYHPFERVR